MPHFFSAYRSRRPKSKKPVIHKALRIEDFLHRVRSSRGRRRGYKPLVIAYTGYGSTSWVRVLGRVVLAKPDANNKAHSNRVHKKEESIRGWRLFTSIHVTKTRVTVTMNDQTFWVQPDRGGVIDAVLSISLSPGWHALEMHAAGGTKKVTATVNILDPDTHFGVISDIDDTVMITALPRPFVAAWNTFILHEHARASTPGMAVLFERLCQSTLQPPVFYLSTGAWNVAPTLKRFLSRNLFPTGPLLLTDWGPTPEAWFRSGFFHKQNTLQRLAEEFPNIKWLLLGDDGQHDEEIYKNFCNSHPNNVAAVAIRQLSPSEAVLAGGRSHQPRHEQVNNINWVYSPHGAGLSEKLQDLGFLAT